MVTNKQVVQTWKIEEMASYPAGNLNDHQRHVTMNAFEPTQVHDHGYSCIFLCMLRHKTSTKPTATSPQALAMHTGNLPRILRIPRFSTHTKKCQ